MSAVLRSVCLCCDIWRRGEDVIFPGFSLSYHHPPAVPRISIFPLMFTCSGSIFTCFGSFSSSPPASAVILLLHYLQHSPFSYDDAPECLSWSISKCVLPSGGWGSGCDGPRLCLTLSFNRVSLDVPGHCIPFFYFPAPVFYTLSPLWFPPQGVYACSLLAFG